MARLFFGLGLFVLNVEGLLSALTTVPSSEMSPEQL